ncbi:hypothetical protein ACQ1Z4_14250, partial [Enterococcus faecalis]|uniref:hypothetical protein n=1 Tax=Enterococcus faecalis TaxID=1351 RepID=UPI003D6B4136
RLEAASRSAEPDDEARLFWFLRHGQSEAGGICDREAYSIARAVTVPRHTTLRYFFQPRTGLPVFARIVVDARYAQQ